MNIGELFSRLDQVIANSRIGILTTVDEKGYPRSRWMTPTLLCGRECLLYAVSAPHFPKAAEIANHPQVGWLFQSRSLDEVITLCGRISIIDNPSLKSEVLEAIGGNLAVFWRANPDESSLVVLETAVEYASLYLPMKNERYKVVV